MPVPFPLLRSPPFPWVDAFTAAISHPAFKERTEPAIDLEAVKLSLAQGRVGGSFWAPPVTMRARAFLKIGDGDFDRRIELARRTDLAEDIAAIIDPDRTDAEAIRALAAAAIPILAGPLDPWSALGPGVTLFADAQDEWALIAALAGAKLPGLDPDDIDRRLRSALLADADYRDCFHDRPTGIEHAIAILSHWRSVLDANRAIAAATGISWWKERAIRHFLWSGGGLPDIAPTTEAALAIAAPGNRSVAVWPSRAPDGLAERARALKVPVVAIEDGFIRSVGLGSDLHPPWSIVVDRGGIYYDPQGPSDLETILSTTQFTPAMLDRADRLRATIVARGISKYSGAAAFSGIARDPSRRTVLVAGQVEDDMSVKAAGAGIAGNLDLLIRARRAEPNSHILFKPHPDVDAGHRVGRVADMVLLEHADAIVRDEAMPSLLKRVDAVHVLSSLTGFEALLRGLDVTVHGQPFYAGWGLTRDLAGGLERRTRKLTLAELVAGTLIAYPRYLDPKTELPCPPEILLERFAEQQRPAVSWLIRIRRWQGRMAKLFGTTTD